MMDCSLEESWTYIFYFSCYFRKLFIACLLTPLLSGSVQLFGMLIFNSIIVVELLVIIYNRYFGSKIKIGLKLLFNIMLVCIDMALILGRMDFVVGEFCKIASYVTVVPGLMESLLKIAEAIYNVIRLNSKK